MKRIWSEVALLLAGSFLILLFSVRTVSAQAKAPLKSLQKGQFLPASAEAQIEFGGELGSQYSPDLVFLPPGGSVIWKGDFSMHPLVSDEDVWSMVNSGSEFTHVFDQPGIYHYHCFIHGGPGGLGMSGTVIVGFRIFAPILSK